MKSLVHFRIPSVGAPLLSTAVCVFAATTSITVFFPLYSGRVSPYAQVQVTQYSSLDSVLESGFTRSQSSKDTVSCSVFDGFGLGIPYRGIRVSLGEASMQAWQGYLKIGSRCYVDTGAVFEKTLVQAALKGTFFTDGAPGNSERMACGVGEFLRGDVPCNDPSAIAKFGGPRAKSSEALGNGRAVRPDGRSIDPKSLPEFYLKAPEPARN